MTNPMGRSFFCYPRAAQDEAICVIAALREHGIPTWHDLENLNSEPFEPKIREDLSDDNTIASAVVWLTPDVSNSAFIQQVELPLIVERHRRKNGFFVVPYLRGGLSLDTIDQEIPSDYPLSQFHLHQLELPNGTSSWLPGGLFSNRQGPPPLSDAQCAGIARVVVKKRLECIHGHLDPLEPFRLELHTRVPPAYDPSVTLSMDWHHCFNVRQANEEPYLRMWEALKSVSELIRSHAPDRVVQAGGKHTTTAAFMLGAAFPRPRGIRLQYRQLNHGTQEEELWHLNLPQEDNGYHILPDIHGSLSSRDVAVRISIANDVKPLFNENRSKLPEFRATLDVEPRPGEPRDLTAGQACQLVHRVHQELKAMKSRHSPQRFHFFISAPVGFVVLLGQLAANAIGPVQFYEPGHNSTANRYLPSAGFDPVC